MPAPIKVGLNYFSHDTNASGDPKIEYIEALHGLKGYAVYMKLLEKIYTNGYYIQWDTRDLVIFSKHININKDECNNIVNDCINEGLFSQKLYDDYKILTSEGIQKRYIKASERRNKINFIDAYILVDISWINANINKDNVNIISKNVDIYSQSKEKESKEKENKIKEIPYEEIITFFNLKAGTNFKHTSKKTQSFIHARWEEGYRLDDFKYVIEVKCHQWLNDPKMNKFLRPETLYGTKFESYRNEKIIPQKSKYITDEEFINGRKTIPDEI